MIRALALLLLLLAFDARAASDLLPGVIGRTGTNEPPTGEQPEPPPGSPTCNVGICSTGGNCTGEAASCAGTCSGFTSATGISTINSLINGAGDGDVVCLARGNTWTGATGINLTASHPDAGRVTICASAGTQCSTSGAADPRLSITGTATACVFVNADGYNFTDIDCTSANTSNDARGYDLRKGSRDLTFEGGRIANFKTPAYFDDSGTSSTPITNLKWGTCTRDEVTGAPVSTRRVEITGGPVPVPPSSRAVNWGCLRDSNISLYVHHFDCNTQSTGGSSTNCTFSHWLDIACNNSAGAGTANQTANVTVECGLYDSNGSIAPSSFHKVNKGVGVHFLDNQMLGTAGAPWVAFGGHGAPNEGITGLGVDCAGSLIARNYAEGGGLLSNEFARDVCVDSNVFKFTTTGGQGFYRAFYGASQELDRIPIANVKLRNNTVYDPRTSSSGFETFWRDNPGAEVLPLPTDNVVLNNVIVATRTNPLVFTANETGCNGFGTNGVNIKNNFLQAPGSPNVLWTSCSADSGNSATFATAPDLVSVATGNFRPTGAGANVCTLGTTPRPALDFEWLAWTQNEVGAYRCAP